MSDAQEWTVYYHMRRKEYKVEKLDYQEEGWTRKSRVGFSQAQARVLAIGMAYNRKWVRQAKLKRYIRVDLSGPTIKIIETRIRIHEGG